MKKRSNTLKKSKMCKKGQYLNVHPTWYTLILDGFRKQ